uniref:Transmembrane protein 199 n=1 Tax=Angiostrongylus cantonensis TaxID=6313 RepID=A0A0K0DF69_ANGCA
MEWNFKDEDRRRLKGLETFAADSDKNVLRKLETKKRLSMKDVIDIKENLAYKRIVRSVDASQKYGKVDHLENFGAELRIVNRQLISVVNVVITVAGAFFFGFSGVQYAYPQLHLDIATRFIIGLVPATVVFFADLYFILKTMDQDDSSNKCPLPNVLNFKELLKKDS